VPSLKMTYLGLPLPSPLVAAASPLSRTVETIQRMEDAGAGAVVLFSLFQEQIVAESGDRFRASGELAWAPTLEYLPAPSEFRLDPDAYLEHVRKAKAVLGIPLVASLNGATPGDWTVYARLIEEAGADALELNLHQLPFDLEVSGEELERLYLELIHEVRHRTSIPLALKLGPYFTNLASFAHRAVAAGADGLVLFNRFYQPELDLASLELAHHPRLSTPGEPGLAPLALHWIATLHGRLPADLVASGGIHRADDVLKAILVGASAVQMASALMANGVEWLGWVRSGLVGWLEEHHHRSLDDLRGQASLRELRDPAQHGRANYLRVTGTTHPPGLPWRLIRGD
jgi:dihydroorotate dehydrogenase (fumarate)